MIEMEGYPAETHTVITDDCYILEMHRIPNGKGGKNKARYIILVWPEFIR